VVDTISRCSSLSLHVRWYFPSRLDGSFPFVLYYVFSFRYTLGIFLSFCTMCSSPFFSVCSWIFSFMFSLSLYGHSHQWRIQKISEGVAARLKGRRLWSKTDFCGLFKAIQPPFSHLYKEKNERKSRKGRRSPVRRATGSASDFHT
jgi:hypothetical protein